MKITRRTVTQSTEKTINTVRSEPAEVWKPKSEKQIRAWLKNPHSDSAEYKLWGNGVALPCVFFVLSGIAWVSSCRN